MHYEDAAFVRDRVTKSIWLKWINYYNAEWAASKEIGKFSRPLYT